MTEYDSDTMRDRGHLCKKSDEGMGKEYVAGSGGVTAGTFVMFAGGDDITVVTCGLDGPIIGVAMNDALEDEVVGVQMDGYHWISADTEPESTVAGVWVVSTATGQAKIYSCPQAAGETTLGGYVLSSQAENDDCICLKIQLMRLCVYG